MADELRPARGRIREYGARAAGDCLRAGHRRDPGCTDSCGAGLGANRRCRASSENCRRSGPSLSAQYHDQSLLAAGYRRFDRDWPQQSGESHRTITNRDRVRVGNTYSPVRGWRLALSGICSRPGVFVAASGRGSGCGVPEIPGPPAASQSIPLWKPWQSCNLAAPTCWQEIRPRPAMPTWSFLSSGKTPTLTSLS